MAEYEMFFQLLEDFFFLLKKFFFVNNLARLFYSLDMN